MASHIEIMVQAAPGWVYTAVLPLVTCLILHQIFISYSWGSVVATLAMVEEPTPTAVLHSAPVANDDEVDATLPSYSDSIDDKKPLLVEQEVLLVTPKPITASVRGTIRHLRAETGSRFSNMRGAWIVIFAGVVSHLLFYLIAGAFPPSVMVHTLGFIFVQLALCRITMLWTHVVISKPSAKSYYDRIVPRSSARKIYLPTLGFALAQLATAVVPVLVFYVVDCQKYTSKNFHDLTCNQRLALALKLFTVFVSGILTVLTVLVPVQVALTRCQAALLAEDESPIVPFDRTFGGRVVPQSEGGSGRLSMKDAWRSFDWNARVRLAKVWAKTFGMQAVSFLVFSATIALVATVGVTVL